MLKKKEKINLNLEDSPLYNRRKNMEATGDQYWAPTESASNNEKQSSSKSDVKQNENVKPNKRESQVYDIPYAPKHSLPHMALVQETAVDSESHIYESIKGSEDHESSELLCETDTPTLERQNRNLFLANIDLEEELKQQPPSFSPPESLHIMSLNSMTCTRCGESFEPQEKIVNSNGQLWHTQCFVCAQCFRPFPDDIFYEFEGRKYCEHDFQVLFAPCCGKCNEFIIGRVIKAMNFNWHPQCFTCELCDKELADLGFIRNAGRALCHECNARVKAESQGKYMCHRCHSTIDGQPLRWRGDTFHPYHFNCASCGIELTADAREVKSRPGYTANDMNELYCLRCHDKMGIPICGACRRPIEERVVTALGKHWHVEHFVCAKCEKPFMGNRHYERKGLAYCETHYHELFGNLCFVCNAVIYGDVVMALNKAWCTHHFACALCDTKMTQKTKFFEFDQKPICKKCYERFPQELKKRLKRQHEVQARGGRPIQN